uniref:Proliferation marker protein Ki-67-like n=1 Tax=Phallusia mammillata TaxID=59560 RepID=A0A6F9DLL2_9ASCI|nr:proliferation marker protein Ki-67-like [Phallusia mammillata]
MPVYGKVIVIRRNGSDGSQFPLTSETCLFGRKIDCDVRVQLPYVSNQQCKLQIDENGKFMLHNLSKTNQTIVNGKAVENGLELAHKDVLTIVDRSFRFEYPESHESYNKSPAVISAKAALNKPRTPLQEAQASTFDSPFSLLVKDMKQSIKLKTTNKTKNEVKPNTQDILTPGFRKNDPGIISEPRIDTSSSFSNADGADNAEKEKGCETESGELVGVDTGKPLSGIDKEVDSIGQPGSVDISTSVSTEPTISLSLKNMGEGEESDPYKFSQSESATEKKYRRRSSGSSGLSRKKQLALFGSPRTPNMTPLRRSLGELKKKSIPLVEEICEEVSISPHNSFKKNWDPLPEVEEIENNSSPIKKNRRSLKNICESPLVPDESIKAVQRKSSRVSFGPKLSPEQFLKHLPPNTPVKKGATPHDAETMTRRKSVRLSSLCTVSEASSSTSSSLDARAKKPTRTPTPYRKSKSGNKQPNLLHNAIQNAMDKKLSQSTTNDLGVHANETERTSEIQTVEQVKSRKSTGNVTLLNVHRTATNLHKRKSIGKLNSKPLWSDIVKRAPANKQTKPVAKNIMALKDNKVQKNKQVSAVSDNSHHCESPATLYIGKTHKRILPTRTPRPPKGPAPIKLNIPLDESFTGIEDMFQTPAFSAEAENFYKDLQTPPTIGEMQLSPLNTSDEVESDVEQKDFDLGASPVLCKKKVSKIDSTNEKGKTSASVAKTKEGAKNIHKDSEEGVLGTERLFKTPKSKKNQEVEEKFGLKRMFKTPKDKVIAQPVEDKFGTKRLLKTPKVKENVDPVADKFGTKRLLRTPAIKRKYDALDESICMDEMMKTPEPDKIVEKKPENIGSGKIVRSTKRHKNEAVSHHFGTKRLFKTPKTKNTSEAVTEKFGTKRLLTTPKCKNIQEPVDDKFGMKRLFQSPREQKQVTAIVGSLGFDRLFGLPTKKYQPVQDKYGTVRLFQTHTKRPKQEFNDSMCLDDLFQEDHSATPQSACSSPKVEPKKVKTQAKKISKVTRKSNRATRSEAKTVKKKQNEQPNSAINDLMCNSESGTVLPKSAITQNCIKDVEELKAEVAPRVTRSGKQIKAVSVKNYNQKVNKEDQVSPVQSQNENVDQDSLDVKETSMKKKEVIMVDEKSGIQRRSNKKVASRTTVTTHSSRCTRSKPAPEEIKRDINTTVEDALNTKVAVAQSDVKVVSSKKAKANAVCRKGRTTRSSKEPKVEEENAMSTKNESKLKESMNGNKGAMKKESNKSVTFHHTVVGGMTPLPVKRRGRTRTNVKDETSEIVKPAEEQPVVLPKRTRKRAAKPDVTAEESKKQKLTECTTQLGDKEICPEVFKPKAASQKKTKSSAAAVATSSEEIETPLLRRSSRRKK